MTNGVPFPLLETSPLYENEDLKEGSIPTVTPIEQVRDEGNCGECGLTSHTGNQVFGASVDASPTQDKHVLNSGCCQQSGRSSRRRIESPDSDPHATWCGRGLGVIRVTYPDRLFADVIGKLLDSSERPSVNHLSSVSIPYSSDGAFSSFGAARSSITRGSPTRTRKI